MEMLHNSTADLYKYNNTINSEELDSKRCEITSYIACYVVLSN